ncbi:hypothetical protein B0A50_01936 [Salinomyces thailandicus]|uniref:CMP/dCMP-type deaminase domain-containing protein n=1 Tax=Salinomyces thailandicus TaxID=706561 RepID=A0A4U0U796_9PEZI|nr:hypothetical protein B0A50_01936 [Salinomyces thailandica]
MWPPVARASFGLMILITALYGVSANGGDHANSSSSTISPATREHWMQRAIQALPEVVSPCPFGAFGTAIVNHTSTTELGNLICIGANLVRDIGNPTLHGEIAAINNCTAVLTAPDGPYKLTATEALAAYKDFTLYTTAEPCPMCATAIRHAGFRECVYATSIDTLIEYGWPQLDLRSKEIFERSTRLKSYTYLLGGVLESQTNAYFRWQFNDDGACPGGCERDEGSGQCLSGLFSVHNDL